jgi:nucleolar protein 14
MAMLIDHILHITSGPTPRFSLIHGLLPHLASLTKAYPVHSAARSYAKEPETQCPLNPESKTWPGLPELTLLRIIGILLPTSDLHHVVIPLMPPTRILMGSYLGLCRVRFFADLASGLFLCSTNHCLDDSCPKQSTL